MAKTYRSLQQWNQWLEHLKGQEILKAENTVLKPFLSSVPCGKHGLLIGVPGQQVLLKEAKVIHRILLSPLQQHSTECQLVESDPGELPIASGSADLVLLPHTLEYTSRPHHLLAEACRVVRPQGHIIIIGFNPLGWWGLKKIFIHERIAPWKATFLSPHKIKHWLNLSDFALIGRESFKPFSSLYMLIAEARVIPCTPIRLRWKQTLPAFRATLAGPSMRNRGTLS